MKALVTVGMPVFNGASYVEEAIRSLLAQTVQEIRLVVSDDRSDDETPVICERLAAEDPRIELIRQPRRLGMVANFNAVLEYADTEFFMWAAQDDHWEDHFLRESLDALSTDPGADAALVTVRFVDEHGTEVATVPPPRRLLQHDAAVRARAIFAEGWGWTSTASWNAMYGLYRREALTGVVRLQDVPGPDIAFAFGISLHSRFSAAGGGRALHTRRILGYEMVQGSDGGLVYRKALGPSGHLYSRDPDPRCRVMLKEVREASLGPVAETRLHALVIRWWMTWKRAHILSRARPQAGRARESGHHLEALGLRSQAIVLDPLGEARTLLSRISRPERRAPT